MRPGRWAVSLLSAAALIGAAGCSKSGGGNATNAAPGGPAAAGFAFAADPCQAVFDSTLAVLKHDHAVDMTLPAAKGAGKQSQLVQVGGKTYIQVDGVWTVSKMTVDDEVAMINENKKTAATTCKAAGDDTVDGQPVAVYDTHIVNEGSASDNRLWISKLTGLPLKIETHLADGGVGVQHMRYAGVTAPALTDVQ